MSGRIARVVFGVVALYCCVAPDSLWLGLHFVWGSPPIQIEAAAA